jgi:hypothetical protein
MNGKLAALMMGLSLLAGCIIAPGGNTGPAPGNITFSWTFGGQPCAAVPQVANVQITIPGQQLQNNGVYACTTAGFDGIQLNNFVGGTYSWEVDGLDVNGTVIYTASGTVNVDGDVGVTVDLSPVSGPTTYAYVSWTFPSQPNNPNPSCTDVGIANVNISIDGSAATQVACPQGQSTTGWQTPYLTAGTHSLSLSALDASGNTLYQATGSFQTSSSQPSSQSVPFQWAVGGLAVAWAWGNAESCTADGLTSLSVQLYDSTNAPLWPGSGTPVPCDLLAASFTTIPPGMYSLVITGVNGATTYSSPTTPAPNVVVQAGVFPPSPCTSAAGTNCLQVTVQ